MSEEVRTACVPTCEILLVAVEVEKACDYIRVRVEDNFIEKRSLPDMNCNEAHVVNLATPISCLTATCSFRGERGSHLKDTSIGRSRATENPRCIVIVCSKRRMLLAKEPASRVSQDKRTGENEAPHARR
jgi:hypothetical protein